MPKRSPNEKLDPFQQAVRNVDEITGSKSVRGETLLRSRKLKRQLAEAKKRLNVPKNARKNTS